MSGALVAGQDALIQKSADTGREILRAAREAATRYRRMSRSDSTWRAYESDWLIFCRWCHTVQLSPLPADGACIEAFIGHEAAVKARSSSTIQRRLAAIRLVHIACNHPNPCATLGVAEVMAGVRRSQRATGVKKAEPLMPDDISKAVLAMEQGTSQSARNRAILCVAYAGALRPSEVVQIKLHDVSVRPWGVLIDIPFSKTDQEGEGQTVKLQKTDDAICPVAALAAWCEHIERGEHVFRAINRHGDISDEPLHEQSIGPILREVLINAGWSEQQARLYSGQSLRRGYATYRAIAGDSPFEIAKQTRHRRIQTVVEYVDRER